MKKILALVLAFASIVCIFTACGSDVEETTTAATTTEAITTTTELPTEATTEAPTTTVTTTTTAATASETTTAAPVTTTTAAPVIPEEPKLSVNDLKWEYSVGVDDGTGTTYIHGDKNPTGQRLTMTTFIKVQPGDSITLDSDKYVFILYGYSDDQGTYIKNSYIDVDPNSTSNWGTSYTFTEGTKFGNGNTMQFPMYIRILLKEKNTGKVIVPESIKDSFTFNIASLEN